MYTLHECIYTHCSRFLSMSYFIQVYGTITVVHLFQYKWRKLCLIPNKFQLPQLLWEVSDLMGPSLIHKEMLIVRILSKSCEDKDGYSELMSVMTIISITHCFLVCLPIQGFCSLFALLLRYFLCLGWGVNYIYLRWIPTLHHHLFPALHPVTYFSIGNCLL